MMKIKQMNSLTARHFDIRFLPEMLLENLPPRPLAFADFGCGDGPFFYILEDKGFVSSAKPVYAVDLQQKRLDRIKSRFPSIIPLQCSVESVPFIPENTLDFLVSTMVMEHVEDENKYLDEIRRVLKPGGKAYITTVYKKSWAWYFRKRQGHSVLDVSHLREYTNLSEFKALLMKDSRFKTILAFEVTGLWFSLIDPILSWTLRKKEISKLSRLHQILRFFKVPIPGYFKLSIIVQK